MSGQARTGARPLVGVTADLKEVGDQPMHVLGDKYARAIAEISGVTPLVIPAMAESQDAAQLVGHLDGLLLSGSPSNVHPSRYGEAASEKHRPFDEARDASALPLIERALAVGLPLLGLCRGFQEINVALGGTLHPAVHEIPGRRDHRAPEHPDREVRYGPSHAVHFKPGGTFAAIAGAEEIQVNSVHGQGLERVAERIELEGWAPDGTPEAFVVQGAPGFALAVQWHPEFRAGENDFSVRLFTAFGEATAAWAARKRHAAA